MRLNSLTKSKGNLKNKKRVGRGNASGKGTYCGRGCKGQGQRKSSNVRPGFEGGQTSLIMRLPKLRGFTNPNKVTSQVVNLRDLVCFKDGDEVNVETLLKAKLIAKKAVPVKLLGIGKIEQKLTINLPKISKTAKDKIIAAGGKVL